MELLQELFLTAIIAVVLSLIVGISISFCDGGEKSSRLVDKRLKVVVGGKIKKKVDDGDVKEDVNFMDGILRDEGDIVNKFEYGEGELMVSDSSNIDLVQVLEKGIVDSGMEMLKSEEMNSSTVLEMDISKGIEVGGNINDAKYESSNVFGIKEGGDDMDDWEGIERTELEKVFGEAVKYVEYGHGGKGKDVQMQLFGLHKLAVEGPCYEPQPMALKLSARAKWNSWQRLGSMSPELAMEQYIKLLSETDPHWAGDGDGKEDRFIQSGSPSDSVPKKLEADDNEDDGRKISG